MNIDPDFRAYSRSIEGSTTPKDLAAFMEILYMTFKDIQWTEDEFAALQKTYAGVLANQENNPQFIFSRDLQKAIFASPFRQALSANAASNASRTASLDLVHSQTTNAADWTFTFVGNVDTEALRPLVETYIASLPGNPATAVKTVNNYDPAFFMATGTATDAFTTKMETPQTYVMIYEVADLPYTVKNAQLASVVGQILTNRLIKTVREDMGAVYSIGAYGQAQRTGLGKFSLLTQFPMKPEMKDEVLSYIASQFKAMESDVTEAELAPVKEYMVKNYTEGREKNESWLNAIDGYNTNGVDTFNPNIETMNSITVQDVQDYMKAINGAGTYRTVILEAAE